jgi:type VI secretion system protein ImpG
MRDDLLFYYERELTFLRHLGGEFAGKYPKVAGRLQLEPGKCEDPHVERLLEAFSFLTARLHLKIDDDFPQIVEALFSILYPSYLAPIPSMSVVQFHLDPEQGKLTSGLTVPRGAQLLSAPVNGVPCQFQTRYATTLWPLHVRDAAWKSPDRLALPVRIPNAAGALSLQLDCFEDVSFDKLDLQTLRLFLQGDGSLTHTIIELLCNNCIQIFVRDLAPGSRKSLSLEPHCIRQVGFAPDEDVLPFPRRSFTGYRLLQEYFTFPEKFLFLDISGFDRIAAAGFSSSIELLFLVSDFERSDRRQNLELGVSARTFRLGCAPIINLFPLVSEPILLEQKKFEYRIVPDARREQFLEIHSIDQVTGISGNSRDPIDFRPFYSYRHAESRDPRHAFWIANRRPSGWRTDEGSDVYITLTDRDGRMTVPDRDTVTLRLSCSNRDLPSRLPFGNENGDFELDGGGPITRIVSLIKPTEPQPPPANDALLWRLASQLSLNRLSIVDQGIEAFREILRLHNFSRSLSGDRHIEGILSVSSAPHFTRLVSGNGISFLRGVRIDLELDEEQFVGAGVYTFAAMLEVFLGLYSSLNSFSQLRVRTRQRKGVFKLWPPRAGNQPIL